MFSITANYLIVVYSNNYFQGCYLMMQIVFLFPEHHLLTDILMWMGACPGSNIVKNEGNSFSRLPDI